MHRNPAAFAGSHPRVLAVISDRRRNLKVAALASGVVAIVLLSAGLVSATIPHSATQVISGCYNGSNGFLRVIDSEAGDACKSGELPIYWNQAGLEGPQGPRGPQGPQGPQGLDGADGADGAPGAEGPAGPQGEPGAAGAAGAQGPAGPQGEPGAAGAAGAQGPAGPTGPQGAQGPAGASGGVSGVEIVHKSVTVPAGAGNAFDRGTADAECPAGKTALGGGHITPYDKYVVWSFPAGGSAWRVVAVELTPDSLAWEFAAYAICANAS